MKSYFTTPTQFLDCLPLKAEQDRKLLQAINQVREREREIMKHDPDFDVDESVYKLRKTPPQLAQ